MGIRIFKIVCIIALLIFLVSSIMNAEDEYIHPVNKFLIKLYPRNHKLYFPEVPRITASAAYTHYLAGTALFIHIDEGARVPGSIHMKESDTWTLDISKLERISKGKRIIIFCS